VSRSKHTDPRGIRAARRLRAPREGRGAGAPTLSRRRGRSLKAEGIASEPTRVKRATSPTRPRIVARPPRPGFHHPASPGDLLGALEWAGPEASYGVRTIELRRAIGGQFDALPSFGRYCVPGRIVLYEQPIPPWHLRGVLAPDAAALLQRAGAALTVHQPGPTTVVEWPGDTLRDFMLVEVLLHEIGHHVLQHHKGKRAARIARTGDHEAFARAFVKARRLRWSGPMEAL